MKRPVYMVVVLAIFFLVVSGCGGDDEIPDYWAWFGIGEGGSWPWDDIDINIQPYRLIVELSITDENAFVIPDFVEISLYTTLYPENCGSYIYSGTPLLSTSQGYYPQRASTDNFWTYKETPTAFVKLTFGDILNDCGTYADGDMTITVDYSGYAVASTTYTFYLESSWDWPSEPEATIYLQLVPE